MVIDPPHCTLVSVYSGGGAASVLRDVCFGSVMDVLNFNLTA